MGHREGTYIMAAVTLPAERKALLFSAGGVRLALRLPHLREIVAVPPEAGEVQARGAPVPTAFVSTVLGLPAGPSPYALLTEGAPQVALRVEGLHGIVDLAGAEFFQLPARTPLPQPAPFAGVLVVRGQIALELAVGTLGFAPLEPAEEGPEPGGVGAAADRELRFARGDAVYAVPLGLLVQVLESPVIAPVPLTPPSHRGLLYHGRALHPVVDLAVLRGVPAPATARTVLLLDAGGAGVGVLADRVLGVGEGGPDVIRPAWDALFAGI
jgi:chemotaxis signal transduction protein